MVIFDANFLLLLIDPNAKPPKDPSTGAAVAQSKEKIEHLLAELLKTGERVGIPTPALSESLVGATGDISGLVAELTSGYKLTTLPFDEMAAIEVALMSDGKYSGKGRLNNETKAKVKYDLQIVGVAKAFGAETIYTTDNGMKSKAADVNIRTVGLEEITLPPEKTQQSLPFSDSGE